MSTVLERVVDEMRGWPAAGTPPVSEKLWEFDQQVTRLAELTSLFLRPALFADKTAQRFWQHLIRRPSAELHAARGNVLAMYERMLEIVEATTQMAKLTRSLTDRTVEGNEQLPEVHRKLAQFVGMVRDRWTSQEELEELMADTFELPKWLAEGNIPPHLQPPQSWYDETTDPFKPADV